MENKLIGDVSSFRDETFCKSMVRPGRQSCVGCYYEHIEALCVRASCWWTVLRVVFSSAHHVCPRFVLVISR